MKYKIKLLTVGIVLISLFSTSCDQLMKALEQGLEETKLSETEIIKGLKEALNTGASSSTKILHACDGYFKDEAVKIFLPKEAQVIVDNIRRIPGVGDKAIDDVILKINRSAEDAAIEAKPIIIQAVKEMTVRDGMNILQGKSARTSSFDSTAATFYLRSKTYNKLYTAFKPKINTSLNKKLVGNVSTNTAWSELVGLYNKVAPIIGKPKVNADLPDFVTKKALDGLFVKIGDEEKKIRKNPYSYAREILRRVFGSVHK